MENMFTNEEELNLLNLAEGAAIELFQYELIDALKNVHDPNRDAKAKREIIITAVIEPTDAKGVCAITVKSKSKLAGRNGITTHILSAVEALTGRVVAHELKSAEQTNLPGFPSSDSQTKVRPIK